MPQCPSGSSSNDLSWQWLHKCNTMAGCLVQVGGRFFMSALPWFGLMLDPLNFRMVITSVHVCLDGWVDVKRASTQWTEGCTDEQAHAHVVHVHVNANRPLQHPCGQASCTGLPCKACRSFDQAYPADPSSAPAGPFEQDLSHFRTHQLSQPNMPVPQK